jgi:hypothetical protein
MEQHNKWYDTHQVSQFYSHTKNRLAKPKLDLISHFKHEPYWLDAPDEYFEQIGIAKGKMNVDKSTGEMTFVPGG